MLPAVSLPQGPAIVCRARDDEQLERDVALKVLPSGTLADEAARRHFRKEATSLAKLNHPHVETVYCRLQFLGRMNFPQ